MSSLIHTAIGVATCQLGNVLDSGGHEGDLNEILGFNRMIALVRSKERLEIVIVIEKRD